MATEIDRVLCVKNEVFVYKIPARVTNRGYRAADWTLDNPDWTGRLRVVSHSKEILLKLEDKNSGELFAMCPIDCYPSAALEQVLDSSRYFVVQIKDEGRRAFIGIGFADRADSFDLLVTLQDHFKQVKREDAEEKSGPTFDPGPKLDLGFKEGQTIKINISAKKDTGENGTPKKSRPKPAGGAGFLPPPPGGVKISAPPKAQGVVPVNTHVPSATAVTTATAPSQISTQQDKTCDLLGDLSLSGGASSTSTQPQSTVTSGVGLDPWGDFTSSNAPTQGKQQESGGTDWVQF